MQTNQLRAHTLYHLLYLVLTPASHVPALITPGPGARQREMAPMPQRAAEITQTGQS